MASKVRANNEVDATRSALDRIDAIRSVAEMKQALGLLAPQNRKRVILRGLEVSRNQFTWSHMANLFKVPESEWPKDQACR